MNFSKWEAIFRAMLTVPTSSIPPACPRLLAGRAGGTGKGRPQSGVVGPSRTVRAQQEGGRVARCPSWQGMVAAADSCSLPSDREHPARRCKALSILMP